MLRLGIIFLITYHVTAVHQGKEVCGSNGRTYADIGQLIADQLETPDLEMIYVGPCNWNLHHVLRAQTTICGSDGKTYNNYRDLMLAKLKKPNLEMVYAEPCPPDFKVDKKPTTDLTLRTIRTSLDNTVVCGTDLRTYVSYGDLEFARLESPYLRVLHLGHCDLDMVRSKAGRAKKGHYI